MKETPREHFRWAAHTGGSAIVKPKDYESVGEVEAPSAYAAWKALSGNGTPLQTGDILQEMRPDGGTGALYLAKYVGFEPATWFVPEPKAEIEPNSCSQ
jgi:hypothetical protein